MRALYKKNSRKSLSIKPFAIESSAFLEILEACIPSDMDFSLTTGSAFSENRFVLENIGDVQRNLDKVISPMSLSIGSIILNVDKSETTIEFEESDEAVALSIVNRLDQYRSIWRSFVHGQVMMFITIIIGTGTGNFVYSEFSISSFLSSMALAFAVAVMMQLLLRMYIHPYVVLFRPRETFWQRNRDTILVGLLMLALGSVTTLITSNILG